MIPSPSLVAPRLEHTDARPAVTVTEPEYRRLLGYPPDHDPGERAVELAGRARRWFADHGRPWVYLREVDLQWQDDGLRLDGVEFRSGQLHRHLAQAGARRALLVAVSAGAACEEHARHLWEEAKPDEYFFLESFGSAVVEHLVAATSGRICGLADSAGLIAVPHYSPGYAGWDVADQNKLFALIARGGTAPFPGPLEVLPSGMLRPKKSLLAVVGLTARTPAALAAARLVPCDACAFSPCRFRRAPYRHAGPPAPALAAATPLTTPAAYTTNPRALRKWARERVRLAPRADGTLAATFRFDGTTCSNQGRPLAFDYAVTLGTAADGYPILAADCRPAPEDEGHKFMCAYLADAPALLQAIAAEQPLLGRPLDAVLTWSRSPAPSGCHCDAPARAHKWGLALEAIHFALAQPAASPATPSSPPP